MAAGHNLEFDLKFLMERATRMAVIHRAPDAPRVSADVHCTACTARAARPIDAGLPLDRRWEWSEVPWGNRPLASMDYEVRRGQVRHAFYIDDEFPACAPWWVSGYIGST